MSRYRIEYYNMIEKYGGSYYIVASSVIKAIKLFRKSFEKEIYNIIEVSMCIDHVDFSTL